MINCCECDKHVSIPLMWRKLLEISNLIFVPWTGAFEDADVTHVEGEVDPVRDLDIISEELRLKDEDTLMKNLEKLEKLVVRGTDKKSKPEYVSLMNFLNGNLK